MLHRLYYDKNYDRKKEDEKAEKMVKGLLMIIYYIPKSKELINNILCLDFINNKENNWLLKRMKLHFKYASESYLTRWYYYTGMTWDWSGWFTYLYNKATLDIDYITFLRKKYNVNNETFDEFDYLEYILG